MKTPTNFIPIIGPLYTDDLQVEVKPNSKMLVGHLKKIIP